jgi:hypothetical protein
MCQWKFFVLKYSANTSASSTLSAAEMSRVASAPRSLGVCSGARRRDWVLLAKALTDLAGLTVLVDFGVPMLFLVCQRERK